MFDKAPGSIENVLKPGGDDYKLNSD